MGPEGWETPYIEITVHKMKKIQSRTQWIIYNDFKWIVSYKIPNHYVVHVKGISYYKSTPMFKKSIKSQLKMLSDIHMKQGDV